MVTQTVDGGTGNDYLYIDYSSAIAGITSTFNTTTNRGLVTADTNQVRYKNIERLEVIGTAYDDNIVGSNGDNKLYGGVGNDTLTLNYYTRSDNILIGGTGNDFLIGVRNKDTFVFNSYNEGLDNIYEFDNINELIQISATSFGGGLTVGSLSASQFTLGIAATMSDQRFIYNNNTGALYFDQDGSNSGSSFIPGDACGGKLRSIESGLSSP